MQYRIKTSVGIMDMNVFFISVKSNEEISDLLTLQSKNEVDKLRFHKLKVLGLVHKRSAEVAGTENMQYRIRTSVGIMNMNVFFISVKFYECFLY